MEPRTLLSTGVPLLSGHALQVVVHEVRSIVGTLARTGNTSRASAALTRLSSRIPSGPQELAPTWRGELAFYRPGTPGSGMATETRIIGDLYRYVRGGSESAGGSQVTAPVSTTQPTSNPGTVGAGATGATGDSGVPTPAQSLDSVSIQNTTGLDLRVTVYLRVAQVQQPWITEIIPAGSPIVDFNFGSATGAFMTMNVSMANDSQTPPPFLNVALDQPISGYDGTLFTISLFSGYFSITPG